VTRASSWERVRSWERVEKLRVSRCPGRLLYSILYVSMLFIYSYLSMHTISLLLRCIKFDRLALAPAVLGAVATSLPAFSYLRVGGHTRSTARVSTFCGCANALNKSERHL